MRKNKNLTPFNFGTLGIQEFDKYAFIVQALDHFNPFIEPQHPVFSSSVITESYYCCRNKVGFIYLPKSYNVKLMTVADSVHSVIDPKSILNTILSYSYVNTNVERSSGIDEGEEWDDGYFPFNVFMEKCKSNSCCNEIVLTYPIEPVGTFFRYDADKSDKDMAIHLASYCGVPLVKLMLNGHAVVMKSL